MTHSTKDMASLPDGTQLSQDCKTSGKYIGKSLECRVYPATWKGKTRVAAKVVGDGKESKLQQELAIMVEMVTKRGSPLFPKPYGVQKICKEIGSGEVLVMELCGEDLSDVRRSKGKLGLADGAQIGLAMLDPILALHVAGWLHGDIKPNQFVQCRDALWPNHLLLLDFDQSVEISAEMIMKRGFRGCSKYASHMVHDHEHIYTAADDLWSWLFAVITMIYGGTPWLEKLKDFPTNRKEKRAFAWAEKRKLVSWLCAEERTETYNYHESLRRIAGIINDWGDTRANFAEIRQQLYLMVNGGDSKVIELSDSTHIRTVRG